MSPKLTFHALLCSSARAQLTNNVKAERGGGGEAIGGQELGDEAVVDYVQYPMHIPIYNIKITVKLALRL